MPLTQTAAPAAEPLSITDVCTHLRIDTTNQEPAPTAPTVALAAVPAAGNVDNGAHRYCVTFVTAAGETQAGTVSSAVTVADKAVNGQVAVSAIPVGSAFVTARKLYRTAAGGSTYLYLATIADNSTTTYTDNIADASLGAGAPSTNGTGDALLSALISAARQYAETITRRALVTQTWKLTLDAFPAPGVNIGSANWYGPQWGNTPGPLTVLRPDGRTQFEIFVPLPPLQSVGSIKYYDSNGALQTLDPSAYIVDTVSEPARITPAYGTTWPSTQNRINAVEVTFTCGYGAASAVPAGIKQWMLMRIGSLYEFREEVAIMGRQRIDPLPFVDGLLDPFRVLTY